MIIAVPVADRIKQADGRHGGQGKRKNDGDQRAKLAGAVDAGGFLDGLRQLFKECLHHKQIVLGDHQGNDLTPEGVEQI